MDINNIKYIILHDFCTEYSINPATVQLEELIDKYGKTEISNAIYQIYSKDSKDNYLVENILYLSSSLDLDFTIMFQVFKDGLKMSESVKEAAIGFAENYRNEKCLNELLSAKFEGKWMNEYVEQIIGELKDELSNSQK
jgi:hypothetical protein